MSWNILYLITFCQWHFPLRRFWWPIRPMLCLTLGSPVSYSPPGSVHGIFKTRIPEQVAISCSSGSSQSRDWICISCIGRPIHYHWATWEEPPHAIILWYFKSHSNWWNHFLFAKLLCLTCLVPLYLQACITLLLLCQSDYFGITMWHVRS